MAFILSTIYCPLSTLHASSSQLKEGNRQFKKGNYEQALELYKDGLVDAPYSSVLHFNAGNATTMMGELPKAEVSYSEAAKSSDPILRGASHYNRANTLFYQGKWDDAVEAYKESLRANPRDEDAKYNLGVALKAQKNPPKSPSGAPKSDPKKGGADKNKEKDKKDGKANDSQKQDQPKPGQMSKEDAERLIEAAAAGEKKKSNQNAGKPGAPKTDEDW